MSRITCITSLSIVYLFPKDDQTAELVYSHAQAVCRAVLPGRRSGTAVPKCTFPRQRPHVQAHRRTPALPYGAEMTWRSWGTQQAGHGCREDDAGHRSLRGGQGGPRRCALVATLHSLGRVAWCGLVFDAPDQPGTDSRQLCSASPEQGQDSGRPPLGRSKDNSRSAGSPRPAQPARITFGDGLQRRAGMPNFPAWLPVSVRPDAALRHNPRRRIGSSDNGGDWLPGADSHQNLCAMEDAFPSWVPQGPKGRVAFLLSHAPVP